MDASDVGWLTGLVGLVAGAIGHLHVRINGVEQRMNEQLQNGREEQLELFKEIREEQANLRRDMATNVATKQDIEMLARLLARKLPE